MHFGLSQGPCRFGISSVWLDACWNVWSIFNSANRTLGHISHHLIYRIVKHKQDFFTYFWFFTRKNQCTPKFRENLPPTLLSYSTINNFCATPTVHCYSPVLSTERCSRLHETWWRQPKSWMVTAKTDQGSVDSNRWGWSIQALPHPLVETVKRSVDRMTLAVLYGMVRLPGRSPIIFHRLATALYDRVRIPGQSPIRYSQLLCWPLCKKSKSKWNNPVLCFYNTVYQVVTDTT